MVVISSIVSTSVQSFVDYALWIVGIMIIYYCVQFFLVAPPSEEKKAAEETKAKEWWDDFFAKRKDKKKEAGSAAAEKRRRESVLPVLDNLEKAVEVAGELQSTLAKNLAKDERSKAVAEAKELAKLAKRALKNTHHLQRKFEGKDRDKLMKLYQQLAAIEQGVEKNILKKFPKSVAKAPAKKWDDAVNLIDPELKKVIGALEAVWNTLEEFYKE